MKLGLEGKVALVTGGSRGIGRSIVETLAQEGCAVLAVSRAASDYSRSLPEIAERTGTRIEYCEADLATPEGVTTAIHYVTEKFGKLDILVNNAGNAKRGNLFEVSDADWEVGFALKFYGYMRLTREAWPLLKAGKGNIINVIGVSGRTPEAIYTIAAAVNAALYAFTKSTAEAGIADGIRVNAVNPSVVETERLRGVIKSLGLPDQQAREKLLEITQAPRIAQPENVADIVAFLASPRAEAINGVVVDVDGGRTKGL